MLSFHVTFVQTDRRTDRRTDRQTTVKQYAPDLSIRCFREKAMSSNQHFFFFFRNVTLIPDFDLVDDLDLGTGKCVSMKCTLRCTLISSIRIVTEMNLK